MDKACVVSALLFFTGNLVMILGVITELVPSLDVSKWKELDVAYIKKSWQTDAHGLEVIGGLLVATAWFVFTIPMIQLAWVLSRGGKRNVPLHTMMVLLVIAGSFTELIARLLQMGMWGILGWVSKDFNISDWIESSDNTGSSDNIGWKTLELISTVIRGKSHVMSHTDHTRWRQARCLIWRLRTLSGNIQRWHTMRKLDALGIPLSSLSFFIPNRTRSLYESNK